MNRLDEESTLEAYLKTPDRETELDFDEKEKPRVRRQFNKLPTYVNWYSAGKVKLGKPVETPEVLKNLPKKPPGVKA